MLLLVTLVCPFGVKLGLFTARIFSHVTQSHLLSTQKVAHFSFHLPLCSVRFLTANQKAFILSLFFFTSVNMVILFMVKCGQHTGLLGLYKYPRLDSVLQEWKQKKATQLVLITVWLSLYPVFSLYTNQVWKKFIRGQTILFWCFQHIPSIAMEFKKQKERKIEAQ